MKADRRTFLQSTGAATLGVLGAGAWRSPLRAQAAASEMRAASATKPASVTLFLCGDVMTGRGIDQILPHPSAPRLYEPYVNSALTYVELAERANGPIARPVDFAYIWGDALDEFHRLAPDVKIVNLETAVTTSDDRWPGKGIHYRMHPGNLPCLAAAGIDCCVLANNHVLDWGYGGLEETLSTLRGAGMKTAGAGRDSVEAEAPAVMQVVGGGRVLVFAFGAESSGVSDRWAATNDRAGVNLLPDLSDETVRRIGARIAAAKRAGDVVVASIHWDANWGYGVPEVHRGFAHGLIDEAGVHVVHGHSSHHPKGIEVYRGRPILYGCGDFLNDYEGIAGYEAFRADLVLMYFLTMDPASGRLQRLVMKPLQMRRLSLRQPSEKDVRWLAKRLDREATKLGAGVALRDDWRLQLHWTDSTRTYGSKY